MGWIIRNKLLRDRDVLSLERDSQRISILVTAFEKLKKLESSVSLDCNVNLCVMEISSRSLASWSTRIALEAFWVSRGVRCHHSSGPETPFIVLSFQVAVSGYQQRRAFWILRQESGEERQKREGKN